MDFGRRRQIWFPATLALLLAMSLPGTEAAESEPTPVSRFPSHLMNGKIGEAARQILKDHTLFRERKSTFRSTPKVYDYVFKRLPLATDMLRVLEFGKYKIGHGLDGSYTIESGTGVKGKFWVLHDADGQKNSLWRRRIFGLAHSQPGRARGGFRGLQACSGKKRSRHEEPHHGIRQDRQRRDGFFGQGTGLGDSYSGPESVEPSLFIHVEAGRDHCAGAREGLTKNCARACSSPGPSSTSFGICSWAKTPPSASRTGRRGLRGRQRLTPRIGPGWSDGNSARRR